MDIVIALLQYYNFDIGNYSFDDLAKLWCEYDPIWVRLAIIESLFRGRYKAVSVDQILEFWQRRGEPYCRFSREFERLICGDFVVPLPSLPRKVTYTSYKASAANNPQTNSQTNNQTNSQTSSTIQQGIKSYTAQRNQSSTHQSAMQEMNLLADSSLFVDKLKSMCKDNSYVPREPNWSNETSLITQLTAYTDI
jgi:hypothetical protein